MRAHNVSDAHLARQLWASIRQGPASVHPLYDHGLRDVLGVGVVRHSERVAELARRSTGEFRAGYE